ncbi:TonB-dependent siderophore receptor [Herbaspirillum sp. LeCh32-8]|uniref:TonB-dependent receptor n=1 Tax=Herbaspirillum sp. LeCh32-8 TaxID=2821356 RepID=UPI001AE2503C|nr:TonB-dependent siderophore receptor [Herbaspirillum sp. LeCh32-8]MBP0599184.1 TonB-dependent siderophore receptor [Herbaspirillum sp. LeCh32-8]
MFSQQLPRPFYPQRAPHAQGARSARHARLRALPLALCAVFGAPALYAAEGGDNNSLPAVEVRSERSHYDPRPGKVATATRTAVDVREVPQTIDSVSVEQVASYGGRTLADALSGVPGISNISDTRFDTFRIRGFSSTNDLMLDGIRDDMQYIRGLGNIERVEVLKGPAAVLYGRGSGGGVINRISKQPGVDVSSSASLTAGSYGRIGSAVDINRVINDEWAVRLNAGREHADSFRNGVDSTRQYLAPSVKWDNKTSSWLLQAEYGEFDRVPDRGLPAIRGANGKLSLPPAAIETTYGRFGRDYIKDTNVRLRSIFTHKLNPDWEIRHVISLMNVDSPFDNTYVNGAGTGTYPNYQAPRTRFQQDLFQRNLQSNLELEGKFNTAAVAHQILAGLEYGKQNRDSRLRQYSLAPSTISVLAPNNNIGSGGVLSSDSRAAYDARSYSVYGQDLIKFNPQLTLLAGLRWDSYEVDYRSVRVGALPMQARRSTPSVLSPRAGLVWTPVADHSFYLSYSKNFSPFGGELLGQNANRTNVGVGPQYSRQYEAGVKSDWINRTISTTLSVFQLDLYNRRALVSSNPDVYVVNGLERNRGVELSVNGELARDWFIRSGFAVQNARLVETQASEANLKGNRSTGVAQKNGNIFIGYAPVQGFFAETGLVYEGPRYVDRNNLLALPGYTRWDGKIGYRFPQVELTLAVTNLADRKYYSTSTDVSQIVPGSPRSAYLSASYRF